MTLQPNNIERVYVIERWHFKTREEYETWCRANFALRAFMELDSYGHGTLQYSVNLTTDACRTRMEF